jgi:hypothetical protein
MADIAYQK